MSQEYRSHYLAILLLLLQLLLLASCASPPPVYRPVATDGFKQVVSHWQQAHKNTKAPTYRRDQVLEVADNLLLMQRNNGGWPTDTNPFRVLTHDERQQFIKDQNAMDASFVNHNIFPQIFYLSHVYLQTGDVRYRNAARKALRLVLNTQLYNGGWRREAQAPSNTDKAVVLNTRVTINALIFLRKVAAGLMPYGYISFDSRHKAADAVRKGDQLLLRLQQAYDSHASIWASAYNLETSLPAAANGEPAASLNPMVSVDIVHYFMQIERPPAPLERAISGAAEWFESNSLQRWRLRRHDRHRALSWIPDYSTASLPQRPVWAQRYDIRSSEPQVKAASGQPVGRGEWFADEGTDAWYGDWARTLLERDYPAWRDKWVTRPGRPSL